MRKHFGRNIIFILIAAMLTCSEPVVAIAAQPGQTVSVDQAVSGEAISEGRTASGVDDNSAGEEDSVPDGAVSDDSVSDNGVPNETAGDADLDLFGNGMDVTANDSVGEILASEISARASEQAGNNGCNIFSVSFNGQTALVDLETIEDSKLVVGVFDETTHKLVSSGEASVSAGSLSAEVMMAETLPAYFVTRAYLVGKADRAPLCSVFETALYTRDMQEFLQKTTDNFDAALVFNYDEDKTNNFLVFNENVIRIKESDANNNLTSVSVTGDYFFTGCDTKLKGLHEGDVVSYEDDENHVTIIKADSVTVNGDDVTIKAAEGVIEDAFDYMKMDDSASETDPDRTLDNSQLEEGVEYKGQLDKAQRDTLASGMGINLEEAGGGIQEEGDPEEAAGIEFSSPYSDTFTISKTIRNSGESAEASISATAGIEIETGFKYIKTKENSLLELKFDCALDLNVSVSGELSCEVPLGQLDIPLGKPVVNIGVTPKLVFRVSAKITAQMEIGATIGFRVENGGFTNLTGSPRVEFSLEGEVSLFAGLGLEPHIQVISDKIAAVTLEGDVGVEVSGKVLDLNTGKNSSSAHLCKICVDGDFHFVAGIKAGARFLKFEIEREITGVKKKLGDWYYSKDLNNFGLGECPNIGGTVNITVKDKKTGDPIERACVSIVNKANASDTCPLETDKYGSTGAALKAGSYRCEVTATGYKKYSFEFTVGKTSGKDPIICMLESVGSSGGGGGEGGDDDDDDDEAISSNLVLGYEHSGIIDENGNIWMWGNNEGAELGTGNFRESMVPVKIKDDVVFKTIGLGFYHSGAIDENGSLWMWGTNFKGQIGNGGTDYVKSPEKIKEDTRFKILSIEHFHGWSNGSDENPHSGAIDEEGNIWTWGVNSSYQLGDGTNTNRNEPVKISDGVRYKALCLNGSGGGALDEDGNLWIWGFECNFGGNNTGNSKVPVLIDKGGPKYRNVKKFKALSLGGLHSGVLDVDGNIWMWGDDMYGQLGGNPTEASSPVKIGNGTKFKALSLGRYHSGAIDTEGNLWMWGYNYYGQLGDGTTINRDEPVKIMEGTKFKALSLGGSHSGAIDEDGNLWMWGCNSYGQLGDGTKTDRHVPVQISLGDGGNNAGALTSDTEDAASGEDGQTAEYAAADNVVEFPAAGAYSINGNEIDFTGLDADSLYNVYSMKNKSAADPLAASNLLYIAQAATDGTGALSVNCVPKASVAAPDIFAVKYRAPVRTVSVSNIVLSRAQLQMKKGETAVLSAEVLPKDANDRAVIWDSTDAGVATVDQNGKVTAVNDGMTFVSATSHDGGYPVFCKVCVSEPSPEPGGPDDPDPIDPDDDIEEGDLPDGRSAPEGIWVGGLKKSYPYTGNAIKPVFRVYKEKNRLNEKTDYTLNYANNKKPGTATVTIKMKGSYSGSKDVTFEISTASLETQVSADTVLKAYKKNSTQKPKPVLYVNGVKLKYGKNDLTFTYPSTASENGTPYRDTGTWKIHIEAKNTKLFTGEKDVDLVIVDKPLMSAVTVTADKKKVPYDNGKPVSPVFTLKYRGQPLAAGSDYTVIYEDDHSSIGKHRVTFAGNNKDFFGTKTYTINITGKYDLTSDLANVSLNSADLNTDGSAPFTYGGAKPEAVVKYNGKKLTPGKDYTVTYTGHKSLGEATATIKGKESFKGSVPVTFSVVKRDINTISPNIADVVYSAKKDAYKKTSIMFVDSCFKDQKLKKDSDYTLTFTGDHGDAPAAGTQIKVVLEGKGNYTGKIDASYRIIDKDHDLTKAKVTVNGGKAYDYTGNEIRPALSDIKVTLNGAALKDDCYEILGYYNNVKKGNSAYIRLRGKGEYAGVKMVKFKIGAAFLEKMWDGIIQRILTPEEKTDNCTCSAAAKIIE